MPPLAEEIVPAVQLDPTKDIDVMVSCLIHGGSSIAFSNKISLSQAWREWIQMDPEGVAQQLKPEIQNERVLTRVMTLMSFNDFQNLIKRAYPLKKGGVALIDSLYKSLKAWGSQLSEIETLEELLYRRLVRFMGIFYNASVDSIEALTRVYLGFSTKYGAFLRRDSKATLSTGGCFTEKNTAISSSFAKAGS